MAESDTMSATSNQSPQAVICMLLGTACCSEAPAFTQHTVSDLEVVLQLVVVKHPLLNPTKGSLLSTWHKVCWVEFLGYVAHVSRDLALSHVTQNSNHAPSFILSRAKEHVTSACTTPMRHRAWGPTMRLKAGRIYCPAQKNDLNMFVRG